MLKPFLNLFPKPPKGWASLGIKQVACAAAVVIRGAETGNRYAKLRGFFQEVGPVVLEFLGGSGIPDFYRLSHLQEVIYMPMRRSGGFEVVTDASTKAATSESAPDVSVKTRCDVELT